LSNINKAATKHGKFGRQAKAQQRMKSLAREVASVLIVCECLVCVCLFLLCACVLQGFRATQEFERKFCGNTQYSTVHDGPQKHWPLDTLLIALDVRLCCHAEFYPDGEHVSQAKKAAFKALYDAWVKMEVSSHAHTLYGHTLDILMKLLIL